MLAVSNTSPVSNLASIGHLDLLKFQFSLLLIPDAVASELLAHPDPVALAAIQTALREHWIRTALAPNSELLNILMPALDKGEAEAIALAVDRKADIVLIDEREARQFATRAGLPVTGVLGILLNAKRAGQIVSMRQEIQALRDKARFFIARSLEATVLSAAGES
jgi:uncharacterized protein